MESSIKKWPIEKRLSLVRLVALSACGGVVDFSFAVEGAYALSLILASGIPMKYATLIWIVSPGLQLLIMPALGSFSDRCTCRWGRRRPFIVALCCLDILGFALAPYTSYLKLVPFPFDPQIAYIVGTLACITMIDISCGLLNIPVQSYLLDVTPESQVQTGNFVLAATHGFGAFVGFVLCAINWRKGTEIILESQVIFGISVIIVLVCLFLTSCSVKEDRFLPAEMLNAQEMTSTCCITSYSCQFKKSFTDIGQFVYKMSKHMWLVFFWFILANIPMNVILNNYTNFVAMEMYNGDSDLPEWSTGYSRYKEGIQIGSWGLAISTIAFAILSLAMDYLTQWIDLKLMTLSVVAVFMTCSVFLMCFHIPVLALILPISYGIFFGLLITLPYVLLHYYEVR